MKTLKMINIIYYLGTDAKELEKNNWFTLEEAILEAQRVASALKHPISVFMLLNGITIKICTVLTDTSVNYDQNIFTDGTNIISTILAIVEEEDEFISTTAIGTLEQIAEINSMTEKLTPDDYSQLLGDGFMEDAKRLTSLNFDSFFNIIGRIDNIIDTHRFKISNDPVVGVRSLLDSYVYSIQSNPEDARKVGLVGLVKRAAEYARLSVPI